MPGSFQYLNIPVNTDAILGILLRLFLPLILYDPKEAKISSHTEFLHDISDLTLKDDILGTLFFSALKMKKLKRSEFEFL